uniref:Domain of unknown function at the cortex 1 domain-containing protein n=1 Tax=Alexandrium monilatum TaxID=311494 RepID=A0A7S4UTN1_9DINO
MSAHFARLQGLWPPFRRRHALCAVSAAGVLVGHRANSVSMETLDCGVAQQCLHLSVDGSAPRPLHKFGKAEFSNGHASGHVAIFARSTPQELSRGFAFDHRNVESGMLLELSPRAPIDERDVFVGIQIPGPLPMTWTTRWVTKLLLSVCSAWAPIHSSVGSHSGMEQDRFDVLPLDGEFADLQPGYTYTWEYGSTTIDLSSWRFVNLPVAGSFPLKRLWGDLPLEIVAYTVPRGGRHLVKDMSYLASVRLSFLDRE